MAWQGHSQQCRISLAPSREKIANDFLMHPSHCWWPAAHPVGYLRLLILVWAVVGLESWAFLGRDGAIVLELLSNINPLASSARVVWNGTTRHGPMQRTELGLSRTHSLPNLLLSYRDRTIMVRLVTLAPAIEATWHLKET